jgi:hypothetical protein
MYIENNALLDFNYRRVNCTSGETDSRKKSEYKGLHFDVSGSTCLLHGSLHKYYNDGLHNANDFTFEKLQNTLNDLESNYRIDLNKAVLHTLEAGVNLILAFDSYNFLRSLVCHKKKQFNEIDKTGKLKGYTCAYDNYKLKIYDKSAFGKHILRIEVKVTKMRLLKTIGIQRLSDLRDAAKVEMLLLLLLDKIKGILFYDFDFDYKGLSKVRTAELKQYSNINFWKHKLLTNEERKQYDKRKRYKDKNRYAELIEKYNLIDWGKWLSGSVSAKWHELMTNTATDAVLAYPMPKSKHINKGTFTPLEYIVQKSSFAIEKNIHKVSDNTQKREKSKAFKKKGIHFPDNPRFCKICGKDITRQRAGSMFCSERIFGKEAKQCRNKDSNRRLARRRKLTKAQANNIGVTVTYPNEIKEPVKPVAISLKCQWVEVIKNIVLVEVSNKRYIDIKFKRDERNKSPP